MSNLYENIEYLCAQNNTNVTQMCKSTGIVRSVLSELASGRTKNLSSENKSRIASFFKVDVEYLDKDFDDVPCPLCGFNYSKSDSDETNQHVLRHTRWKNAVKRFGFCWNYVYRECAKARARNILSLKSETASTDEKVECYETIYKALFSRALESKEYSISMISFCDYVSAILYNKKANVPDSDSAVYNALVEKYGVKKGNINGTYFDEPIDSQEEKSLIDREPSNIAAVLPANNIYQIPVFSSVSAGFGAYACDEVVEYIPMIIENPYDAQDTIAIKVKGDSMYPKIEDGDIIVVRKQESVDSGSVAVLLLDGDEGLVKKVEYGPDWIELHSFNPEYMTRRFEGADVLRLRIVGLVVGSYKKF